MMKNKTHVEIDRVNRIPGDQGENGIVVFNLGDELVLFVNKDNFNYGYVCPNNYDIQTIKDKCDSGQPESRPE